MAARADVVVIDGDSLKIEGHAFRLHGIDAPELAQTCDNGWMAGQYAAAVLRGLLDRRYVLCIPMDTDRYGRTVARCLRDDGLDLGAEMVRMGIAWAYTRYSDQYSDQENVARSLRIGVHAHGCTTPWDWRRNGKR